MNPKVFLSKSLYHLRRQVRETQLGWGLGGNLLKPRQGSRILLYHGIDQKGRTDLNSRFISFERFRKEMEWLKENAWVVSLQDFFQQQFPPDRLVVALTFDDGYLNNWDLAAPLLHDLGLPATFFITAIHSVGKDCHWPDVLDLTALYKTGDWELGGIKWVKQKGEYRHPKTGQRLKQWAVAGGIQTRTSVEIACGEEFKQKASDQPYWQLVSPSQIQQLAADPLFEIGAHSVEHDNYGAMAAEELQNDLEKSRQWLTQLTGKEVVSLAYPFGIFTEKVRDQAAAAGFERLLALDAQPQTSADGNALQLGRFGVNPHISAQLQIASFISGKY